MSDSIVTTDSVSGQQMPLPDCAIMQAALGFHCPQMRLVFFYVAINYLLLWPSLPFFEIIDRQAFNCHTKRSDILSFLCPLFSRTTFINLIFHLSSNYSKVICHVHTRQRITLVFYYSISRFLIFFCKSPTPHFNVLLAFFINWSDWGFLNKQTSAIRPQQRRMPANH